MSDRYPSHRGGECTRCEGLGTRPDDCDHPGHDDHCEEYEVEDCPECPACDACDGTGTAYWDGHCYVDDCDECSAEDVPVVGYGEDGEEGRVCLPCLTRWHASGCGCERWPRPALDTSGAARVLSVVAQVAAMEFGSQEVLRLSLGAVDNMNRVADCYRQAAIVQRDRADKLRREVLRLRHRMRSYHEVHPSGDRVRPEDLDALLYRAKLAPLPQSDRTYYLARELRGRRERGASVWPRPRRVHGPKGRLP